MMIKPLEWVLTCFSFHFCQKQTTYVICSCVFTHIIMTIVYQLYTHYVQCKLKNTPTISPENPFFCVYITLLLDCPHYILLHLWLGVSPWDKSCLGNSHRVPLSGHTTGAAGDVTSPQRLGGWFQMGQMMGQS